MDRNKFKGLCLGDSELFIHDDSDLADYDQFFEFFLANGEMMARVDALHSQHLRHGAKKDVLGVRLVDLWGERTYPIHRGRPAGRFVSRLVGPAGEEVRINDLSDYHQAMDTDTGELSTSYQWANGTTTGRNLSEGFMSKTERHLMVQHYRDFTESQGWTRSFAVQTVFPYHSRASAFYFKHPYGPKTWAWGENEHNYEIEPDANATAGYDDEAHMGLIKFATVFEPLATRVIWCVCPASPPDRWTVEGTTGEIKLEWDLVPGVERKSTIFLSLMTDRDSDDFVGKAQEIASRARAVGWEGERASHRKWWGNELSKSSVEIPDPQIQRLYDIAMLYMIENVGGSYLPFIGVDNVIYETCMCDNPVMLASLVETNHLALAKQELQLIHKYLPAAQKNASDRMSVVLGITNNDAALIPFYMTEDGVELWQDNVLGMYTSPAAYHTALLTKTASYTDDPRFLRDVAYPWLRGYAEYGRLHAVWDQAREAYLFPIENLGGGGEGYWYSKTMSDKLYWRIFARSDPMFRFADFPPVEWIPLDDLRQLDGNWLDVVTNFRWILTCAAIVAERLGQDHDLRRQWSHVAENLLFPQDEKHYLQHLGKSAEPSLGGPAVGSVFWPAEGTFEDLDPARINRTLSAITGRRLLQGLLERGGRAWDAINGLSYAYTGDSDVALRFLQSFAYAADHRGIEMRESTGRQNYYYLLNQGTFILLARNMLIQTFNRTIRIFPAVPKVWREEGISFTGMPAEGGLLVDGRIQQGTVTVAIRARSGETLVTLAGAFETLRLSLAEEVCPADLLEFDIGETESPVSLSLPIRADGAAAYVKINGDPPASTENPTDAIEVSPRARITIGLTR